MTKTSKYRGVSLTNKPGKHKYWRASIKVDGELTWLGYFPYTDEGERAAAKKYDIACIKVGRKPVNILKPVES